MAIALSVAAGVALGQGDDPVAAPDSARDRGPQVMLRMQMADVRVQRQAGRRLLSARPAGRGIVRWVRPSLPAQRMPAKRVAAVWMGVQQLGRVRASLGGTVVTLSRARLRKGRFRALVSGAARVPARGTLRATLRHRDPRVKGGCPLAAFVRCARGGFAFDDIHRADLRGADLRGADMHRVFAHGAVLAGADLRGADLRGATLSAANLRGARLRGTHLADANLLHARFSRAQLSRAHLCRTKIRRRGVNNRDCDRSGPRLTAPRTARPSVAVAATAAPPPAPSAVGPQLAFAAQAKAAQRRSKRRRPKRVRIVVHVVGPGRVVAGSGGIRCPGSCRRLYRRKSHLVLTARPDRGARFLSWSGPCSGRSRKCRIRTTKSLGVKATFSGRPGPPPPPPTPPTPPAPPGPPPAPPAPPTPPPACTFPPTQDSDGDNLFDCQEVEGWTINVATPQSLSGGSAAPVSRSVSSIVGRRDTDDDGVIDGDEFSHNGDPRDVDTDSDGLDDEPELETYGTDLNNADTDDDSLPTGGGPRNPRLFDGNEVTGQPESNPRNPDTDGDSLSDYYEVVIGGTNPRLANLPDLALMAVPGQEKVQIDLGYTVTQSTGTEQQTASSTETSSSQTTSSQTSRQTTHEVSQAHQVGGECKYGGDDSGCSVSYQYTNTTTDSTTNGSQWGFDNTLATTQQNQEMQSTTAQRQVTFNPAGCIQINLLLRNTGSVAVSVDDFQVLATIPDPEQPNSSVPFATLLPVSGQVYTEDCPSTDSNFPGLTIPPNGSQTVGFSQQVPATILRSYMANPAPIQYDFGAIQMTGTNSAGQQVNFSGDVANAVTEQDASVTVDFGDGTIEEYEVAAAIERHNGAPTGITLGELLGPALADLDPTYNTGQPEFVSGLRNPVTGEQVANGATAQDGAWNLVGNAAGVGDRDIPWRQVVLKPGDAVTLAYSKDSDADGLDDAYEDQIGTDPQVPDTDGDGLGDQLESQTGWTVPLAKGTQSEYTIRPSPLSCDADGDNSPDGAGAGNATYGTCPKSSYPPESERAATHGGTALEGTDPTLADSNFDGLLDGAEPYPDVLTNIGPGGRVPVFLVDWGGPGGGGGFFTHAQAIAVDHNQPMFNSNGQPIPIDSYVVDRTDPDAAGWDQVQKFSGNPLVSAPTYSASLNPAATYSDQNAEMIMAATGISVAPGTVGSGSGAGSPLVANYYPKTNSSVTTFAQTTNLVDTFNGATGADLFSAASGYPGFVYGGSNTPEAFQAPVGLNGSLIGNGFLDTKDQDVFIAHGFSSSDPGENLTTDNALPTQYVSNGSVRVFGSKSEFATPSRGRFVDPAGLAVDRAGNRLYVGDDVGGPDPASSSVNAITRFDIATGTAEEFLLKNHGELAGLRGIAVDPSGDYLYAAAAGDNVVYKLSPSLSILGRFGFPGSDGKGGFTDVWDVDVDQAHGVWVTDQGSNLIQYFWYPFGPD